MKKFAFITFAIALLATSLFSCREQNEQSVLAEKQVPQTDTLKKTDTILQNAAPQIAEPLIPTAELPTLAEGAEAAAQLLSQLNKAYDMSSIIGKDSAFNLVVKIREEFNMKYKSALKKPAFKKDFNKALDEGKPALEKKIMEVYK